MFKKLKYLFSLPTQMDGIKRSLDCIHRGQSAIWESISKIEKRYHDDYVNLHDIRNMVSAMRADISSLTLEMAMKPSMGEQPFVKVSVPMSDYVMEGDL